MKQFDRPILKQDRAVTTILASTTTRQFLDALKKPNANLIRYQNERDNLVKQGMRGEELKAATRKTKALIPCVAFSGLPVQGGKREIKDYDPQSSTGIYIIDIDELADAKHVERVRKTVEDIPSCLFAFNSPSGNGIKAGFNVGEVKNDDEFKALFLKFEQFFKTEYDITIDCSCKDVLRLCFLSYDKNVYENEDAEIAELAELDDVPANVQCFAEIDNGEAVSGNGKWSSEEFPLDKIRGYIKGIPSDNREEWLTVGRAIHLAHGEAGFDLWNEWSKTAASYSREAAIKEWKYFKGKEKSQNIGSIIKLANKYDATVKPVANKLKEKSEIDKFLDRYIHVKIGIKVFDTETTPNHGLCTLPEFYSEMANRLVFDPEQPKKKPVSIAVQWHKHPKRQSAQGERFFPGKDPVFEEEGKRWINTFYLPQRPVDKGVDKLKLFHNHLEYLFPIECEREWFIDWMAYNLQFPGKRCKVTPLHINENKRTGRGWIVELMEQLLGVHNVETTTLETMCGEGAAGGFDNYLYHTIFCSIAETKESEGKRYAVNDKIRSVLTENRLQVNRKGSELKTIDVFTNFFFMSNHNDAINLDKGDRRINVFKMDAKPKPRDYYKMIYGWLKTAGVNQLFYMLMNRDLTDFNFQESMENKAREELINGAMSELELAYNEFVEDIIKNIEEKNPQKLPPAMKRKDFINEVMLLAEDDKCAGRIGYLIRNDSRIEFKVFNDNVNKPQRLMSFDKNIIGGDAIKSANNFCGLCDMNRYGGAI